jgi:hypothetical protein
MTGDIERNSVRVVKHPALQKWGVVYFNHYGRGYYAMNKNSATSKFFGHSRSKAYSLAKQLRGGR